MNGVSSLRFDYPGTANALDPQAANGMLDLWLASIGTAARRLSQLSGTSNIVLVGQGVGATLALIGKIEQQNVCGVALLAPMVSGRAYLRELSLWSTMIDDGLCIPSDMQESGPGIVAGLHMPGDLATAIRAIDLTATATAPSNHVFVGLRPGNAKDEALGQRLKANGYTVQTSDFAEYDALVSNPLTQKIPTQIRAELLTWLRGLEQFAGAISAPNMEPSTSTPLTGSNFREIPVRFGAHNHLSGTLCEPIGGASRATVLLLSTAYDPQAGWARFSVTLARRLAANGVASLRFDSADVGDSPPVAGRRAQILYDGEQIGDVTAAFDFLDHRKLAGPTLLFGRCSGAYLALQAAIGEERCKGCIAVNPVVFRWFQPPSEEMVLRPPRSFRDYSSKAFKLKTFQRVLAGQVDLPTATRHALTRVAEKLTKILAPLFGSLLSRERWNRTVHSDFRKLSMRKAPVCLVYSEGDEGLESFYYHFGKQGDGLAAYPTAEWHIIPDADHNFTLPASRLVLSEIVETLALSLASGDEPAIETRSSHDMPTAPPQRIAKIG